MTQLDLDAALERAKQSLVSDSEREAQRRSFVFGNTKIEFDALTRADVDEIAESLAAHPPVKNG
jgi:hypothetical protein